MTVTFCGHGDTQDNPDLKNWLTRIIEYQIANGADLFYLGNYGGFDKISASIVWDFKKRYPKIQSVLVLAYLNREINASMYDYTTYPPLEKVPLRYAISKRNEWMVDQSDVVIACVKHDWGGAANTLAYAIRKKKRIINYYGDIEI